MPTVPELFALAHGKRCEGPHRCFYCGAPANETIPGSEHVGVGFTARDTCAAPGSPWVCVGCALCHRSVEIEGYAVPQRVREFSWLVTPAKATAFLTAITVASPDAIREDAASKLAYRRRQLAELRASVLAPPAPPFALVLTQGGRTHQLYRGIVCHEREICTLTLELERIDYSPAALAERLEFVKLLIAATGKPRLNSPPSAGLVCSLQEILDSDRVRDLVDSWQQIWNEPLTRLAVFLSPVKEDCARDYPELFAADTGGVRRGSRRAGRS